MTINIGETICWSGAALAGFGVFTIVAIATVNLWQSLFYPERIFVSRHTKPHRWWLLGPALILTGALFEPFGVAFIVIKRMVAPI